jgi:hypothetical protein
MNEKDEICSAQHCISHRKFAMEIMEQVLYTYIVLIKIFNPLKLHI